MDEVKQEMEMNDNDSKTDLEIVKNEPLEPKSKIICYICQKSFTRKHGLSRHKRTVHDKQLKQCNHCHKVYSRNNILLKHIETEHGGFKRPSACRSCGSSFETKEELKNHMKSHELPCLLCHKSYSDKYALKRHIEMVREGTTDSFVKLPALFTFLLCPSRI